MNDKVFPVPADWTKRAIITRERYKHMYDESLHDPETFWGREAEKFDWRASWDIVKNTQFTSPVSIRWFENAKLNITENCIDRHLPARASQTAFIWESDDPGVSLRISYGELHEQVCRIANVLKKFGVKKGDRVTIYLPMIPGRPF